ncbi:MAG: hypothetical protein WD739_00195 [Actinomycetota bacterium]
MFRRRLVALIAAIPLVLVTFVAAPAGAQFPGTNGGIAFVRRSGSGADGYDSTLRIVGPADKRRTVAAGFETIHDLSWTATGRRLAFDGERGGRSGVWVVRADARGLRRILVRGASPSWAPNEGKLAVMTERSHDDESPISQIFIVTLDGERTQITEGSPHFDPAWSPDGGWIAFRTRVEIDGATVGAIGTMRTDGTDRKLLAFGSLGSPDWSPDGRRILFTRRKTTAVIDDGKHDCRSERFTVESVLATDGSDRVVHYVATWPSADGNPYAGGYADARWSPDGQRIVVVEQRHLFSDAACGGDDDEDTIVTFRADGSDYRYLLNERPEEDLHEPAWRPIPVP